MSSTPSTVVSCPYCQRQYTMKMDRAEIVRRQARATCGRCGKSFELASRIVVPGAARHAPLPRALPVQHSTPAAPAVIPPAELDTLMREIVAAADSWAPSSAPRSEPTAGEAGRGDDAAAETTAPVERISAPAQAFDADEITAPVPRVSTEDLAPDAPVPPSATPPVASNEPPAPPRRAEVAAAPLTWIDLADPGLDRLVDPGPPSTLERLITRD